jgi:phosphohistidine phosphatase SixA
VIGFGAVAFSLVALLVFVGIIDAQGAVAKPPDSEVLAFAHTIYLVRHGAYDTSAKTDPEVGGPLTPLGIAEARLVGSRLRGLPLHFDSITSSTMERARETAVIIHELLPDVGLRQSPALAECTHAAGFSAFAGWITRRASGVR